MKNCFIGGKVFLIKKAIPRDKYYVFNNLRSINKIKNSSVFSTRNICHLGHQLIHSFLLKKNTNLNIIIIQNQNNKFDPSMIVKSYLLLKKKGEYV